jgi:uncharacterized protein YwgA
MSDRISPEALGGLLKRIGGFGMQTFNDRLLLQKRVYLMQVFGLFIGYRFNWYLRGPYSKELARDGFALAKRYDQGNEFQVSLTIFAHREDEDRFKEYVRFLGEMAMDPTWLEALGSIHFLTELYPKENLDKVVKRAKWHNKGISESTYREALRYLYEHNLIRESGN